ncbi:MAG: type II secretion system protein M [Culturomica sp.]|jgi:type II secretory pathway component PulM|nr:type II secretion system protein M [Culturomica sp.]
MKKWKEYSVHERRMIVALGAIIVAVILRYVIW